MIYFIVDTDTAQNQNCKPDLDKAIGRYTGKCIFDRWGAYGIPLLSSLDERQNRLSRAELTNGRYPSSPRPVHKVPARSRHKCT